MKKDPKDFLLEINVEELPAGYVRPALKSLQDTFLKEFKAQRIGCGETYIAGTANTLLFYIKDLSTQQEIVSKEVLGPPKDAAFDKKGEPTKQAIGFAKSHGVSVGDLRIKATEKGEYVCVEKKMEAHPTKDILQQIIPPIIKDIYFPKTMRWDSTGLRFARPIESVLAVYGNDRLDIALGTVPKKNIDSLSATKYLKGIKKRCLIDPDERRERIKGLILGAERRLNMDECVDEDLLEEVNFMITSPRVFVGEYDKKFLALPEDVLRASMSKYQRIFPVSKNGRLVNKFIAAIEGNGRDIKRVKRNYENILEARLDDSLFFFNEDTKKPFPENLSLLKDLIFQKDLGNMFEKIERIKSLCAFICEKLNLDSSLERDIERAAELSKLDLTTHMVGEFPSLQGVMGGIYALKSGEKKEVAAAIKEHYLPERMDDALPESLLGSVLAISDKIDNIVGLFGIGIDISSSFDPFAIRRNTQGFIQIIKNKSLLFNIDELIQKAVDLYGDKIKLPAQQLRDKIVNYISERIEFLIGEVRPLELKKAVLTAGCSDIVNAFERIRELASISNERYFLEAAKVVERTSNILKGAKGESIGEVDERLFKEDLEKELWKAYMDSKDRVQDLISKRKYKEVTKEYGQVFFRIIHDFFNNVLVNVEDRAIRLNRLAVMKAINRLYTEKIADLALLPQIVVK